MKKFILILLFASLVISGNEEKKKILTSDERKLFYEEEMKVFQIFKEHGEVFNNEILEKVKEEYKNRQTFISDLYDKQIDASSEDEIEKRENTISMMERFIRKYPKDKQFTPDVLFRLADLFFEKTEVDHEKYLKEYEKQLALFESGELKTEPKEPKKSYDKTILYLKRITDNFQSYTQIDGAYYLLGYIYLQMKNDEDDEKKKIDYADDAKKYFQLLVDKYPQSPYVARAYLRIAEYFYEKKTEPEKPATFYKYAAIENYQKALNVEGSDVLDYAMYKLAWSYYTIADQSNIENYDKAIDIFAALIQKYDQDKEDTIKLYREESIDFSAISFVEGFENDLKKLTNYIETKGVPTYGRDVLNKVAVAYFDGELWKTSVDIFNIILKYYPTHPENPTLYDFIIPAYFKLGSEKGTIEARERFLKDYSEGSEWYKENFENEKAMALLSTLNSKHLYDAAAYHHDQANKFFDSGKKEEALLSFGMASQLYSKFLVDYPLSTDFYNVQYYYAVTLFELGKYEEAARMFKRVRDNNEFFEHAEDASRRLILSYQEELKRLIQDGKEELVSKPNPDDLEKLEKIEQKEMSDVYKELIAVRDKFTTMFPKNEDAPVFSFYNASDFFNHLQFEEARRRFFELIAKYPNSEPARYSLEEIYKSYIAERKYDEAENFYADVQKNKSFSFIVERKEDLANIKKLQTLSVFRKAQLLYSQKKYEDAAVEYLRLYKHYPKSEYALDALRNANFSYKEAKKPLKRIDILKQLIQHIDQTQELKKDEKAQLEVASYILEIADISERFFDFQMTINYFELYLNRFKTGDDVKYVYSKLPQLYYNNQNYNKAAELYAFYGPKLDEKNQITYLFASIESYKKAQNWDAVIESYQKFIKSFGKNTKYEALTIEVYYEMYETYLKMNQKPLADEALQNTFKRFKKLPESKSPEYARAKYLAAKTEFLHVEKQLPYYEKMPIGGNNPAVSIKKKVDYAKNLAAMYDKVAVYYKVPEWSIAAFFRKGYLNKQFAEALFAVKAPTNLDEDEQDAYKEELEMFAEPFEEEAFRLYKEAYEYSKKLNIENDWTIKLLIELNKTDKEAYPIPKTLKEYQDDVLELDSKEDIYRDLTPPTEEIAPEVEEEK